MACQTWVVAPGIVFFFTFFPNVTTFGSNTWFSANASFSIYYITVAMAKIIGVNHKHIVVA